MKRLLPLFFLFFSLHAGAQVGLGMVMGTDFYQHYVNPEMPDVDAKRSVGAAMSSLFLGPKLWMGGNNFSFSVEAHANIAPLAFDVNQYKGLGAVAFPILGKFNFGAASGFNEDKLIGWSLGGGIQYNKTELFGLTKDYADLEREFFPTYVGETTVNIGIAGFDVALYLRLGFAENKASTVNTGFALNFNFGQMAKLTRRYKDREGPESLSL